MTNSIEILSGIYVILTIIAMVQMLRKKRSNFIIGIASSLLMFIIVVLDPRLYWFILQAAIYLGINIAGLFSKKWSTESWM